MRSIDLYLIKPVTLLVAGFSLLLFATISAAQSAGPKEVLAPGYHALTFDAPSPGSYMLPVIESAGNGPVLTMQGKSTQLHDLLGSKYVLLSFIYTQCADVNGCPLATFVTSRVQMRLLKEHGLRDQVRFLSFSFDPKNDTPDAINRYGSGFIEDGFDWQFITTASEQDLAPILARYKQPIVREQNEDGQQTGVISHVLRVFLIDKNKQIRNIYSTSFLHPDTIINDLKTLALLDQRSSSERDVQARNSAVKAKNDSSSLHGSGDNKDGYDTNNYQTNNLSLSTRVGLQGKLLKYQSTPPLGLPPLPQAPEEKLSEAKVQLGRTLFYDRRLSHNETISCAMCHIPEQGFSSNELATAVGIEGRTVRRNSPSLYNAAYAKRLFHDARENSLAQQVWSPLLAHNEMGNPSIGYIVDKLRAEPEYISAFSSAFDGQLPDMKNIGEAIASYERTLVSANSPFDRWHFGQEKSLSNAAQAGYALFIGKAGCVSCHRIQQNFALFSDFEVHNTGVGYLSSMAPTPKTRKILLAPGRWLEVETDAIANSAEPKPNDLGYYEISENPADRWKYKTPSLRNVALSAPYMHDGSLLTLSDVIQFYNRGGVTNELLDPRIKPLGLNKQEMMQLEAFLISLTGDNVNELISDAFAVPVGNRED